jgi:hypothetical protein
MSLVNWLLNVLIPALIAAVVVPPLLLWLRKFLEWLIRGRAVTALDWPSIFKTFAAAIVITVIVFSYLPPHSVTSVDWCVTARGTTQVGGKVVRMLLQLPATDVAVQVKIFLAGSPEPLQEKAFGMTDEGGRFRAELGQPQPNPRSLYLINTAYNYDSPFFEDRWYIKNFRRVNPPRCPEAANALPPSEASTDARDIRDSKQSRGSIERPKPDTTVDPAFPASGTIQLLPSEVGWLAVRKGALYWPKEPSITKSGPWTRTVFEGGPPGKFLLVLIGVDAATNERIINWFEQGRRTGSYPGMILSEGTRVLDEIELSLVQR